MILMLELLFEEMLWFYLWVFWVVSFSIFASLFGEVASILSSCSDNQHLCQRGHAVHRVQYWHFGQLYNSWGRLWLVELQQRCIFHLEKHSHCTLSSATNMIERCEAVDMIPRLSAKNPRRLPDSSPCLLHRQGTVCEVWLGFLGIWCFCQLNVLRRGRQKQQHHETMKCCTCSS